MVRRDGVAGADMTKARPLEGPGLGLYGAGRSGVGAVAAVGAALLAGTALTGALAHVVLLRSAGATLLRTGTYPVTFHGAVSHTSATPENDGASARIPATKRVIVVV
jgi:hypothetical protein